MKRISRAEMIDALVEQDIDDIRQAIFKDDFEFIEAVLRGNGFVPYNNLDDREVRTEYKSRIVG